MSNRCSSHKRLDCQSCTQDWVELEARFEESGRRHRDEKSEKAKGQAK